MKRKRTILLIALTALLVLPFAFPSSSSAETLAQKRARAHVIMAQLAVLDARMERVVERYDAATGQLAAIQSRIAKNERTLAVTRYDLQLAKATLQQRVVAIYKQRPVDLLDVIVATKSFSSMVDQLSMLDRVSSDESTMIDSIASYRTTITAAQAQLATEQVAAQALVVQRTAEKDRVEHTLAVRQSMLRGVKAQIAAIEAAQARSAEEAAVQSGAQVLKVVPVNPDHSSVVAFAESFVGKSPYVWGGASPAGFDCSGFTMYCWGQFGVSLPHNAAAQQAMCANVTGDPQPGDLVFFGSPAYHVGLYIGGGSMVDAPHTGCYVSYGSVAGNSGFGRP
jgi:cell wall-associated NlpC family hydrolase